MSDTLHSLTVRLAASANGEFRQKLLAAVKEARVESWDYTVAGPHVRIRWRDENGGAILIEEMPVKGKKHLRRAYHHARAAFGRDMLDAFLVANLIDDMKPKSNMTYDAAIAAFRAAIEVAIAYPDRRGQKLESWQLQTLRRAPDESQVFFLEVEPADYTPLQVDGKDFVMSVTWGKFEAYSPNSDMSLSDPHYSIKVQKSPAAARKLYKMLRVDPKALRDVSWSGLSDWFRAWGIPYDTHHSQWT